ncbi:uncharacterized protein [Nicotiana sylvestris]|uniref:uncharacterized protein n=1 Tax=Nicotiana sylvestris TaxID=4096 RepID=UPI00388CCC03
MSNINEKIWLFFDANVEWELIMDIAQQVETLMWYFMKMKRLVVFQCTPEYEDFAFCINSSGLFDLGYKGSSFTWWNERSNAEYIFKRLDRILINLPFQNLFPTIEIEHLIRNGLGHAPLFMSCGEQSANYVKPFRFLNFWKKHETFKEMLAIIEDIVKVKEILFEEEPRIANRIVLQQAHAKLKKYLSIEEQYWKKKAGMTWFAEGNRNTRFFHNYVNCKKKKLQLKRIQNGDRNWINDQVQLANGAADFQNQFTKEGDPTNFALLDNVPSMVTVEQNMELFRYPTLEEVKGVVFELS